MSAVPVNAPVIVGGGLAGLATALALAPAPCIVLTAAPLGEQAASGWAQGGVAAAVGADDSPALHAADTMAAGAGLCDADAVARITDAGPDAIRWLAACGARFDRDAQGRLRLGLEAAHGRRRIAHAAGDGTGREIMRALVARIRGTPSVTVIARVAARRLLLADGRIAGVLAEGADGPIVLRTARVAIATGGVGGLFADTTNPRGATGQGLALAARAGATLGDLEFVQFHPTALAVGRDPMPLVSEAVRGEGATLVDETGARFMENELAARDIVSRAVWRHLAAGHRVFLDARALPRFAERFPAIAASCMASGVDPSTTPIPVRPAAHYHMGGIAVDEHGRSSIPGLWACGEASSTGLHGANRLASNSLLEAVACADPVARSMAGDASRPRAPQPQSLPRVSDPVPVRAAMAAGLGVLRDADGIQAAIDALAPNARDDDAALVGTLIAVSALRRRESRGGHSRTDFPATLPRAVRSAITMDDALAGVPAARERRAG